MNLIKNLSYYTLPLIVALFNVLIIFVPDLVISSAKDGLLLWFNKVIPSIFPFLVGTNLLIQLGFIDFLGTLLEDFMKKTFNIPGCGAFALILGMLSGYPIGAKITSSLREHNKITQIEAQRLVSFTNNSGPLFIIGTVGIGMFGNINIGYFVLIIHYLSALTVGIIFKYYKYNSLINKLSTNNATFNNNIIITLKKSLINLKISRKNNNKKFGEILNECVQSSLQTIATIGGFIIIFSVIAEILNSSNIFTQIGTYIFPYNMQQFSDGIFIGIIEITNGIYYISSTLSNNINISSTNLSIIITNGLVSFSGLSILAQTMSILSKCDININIYVFSKILHSLISMTYSAILLYILNKFYSFNFVDAFNPVYQTIPSINSINSINYYFSYYFNSIILFFSIIILLLVASFIFNKFKNK